MTTRIYCPYIPIQIITMSKLQVKFRFKDVGEKRWLGYADVPRAMTAEFEQWMKEFMPGVWVNKNMWDVNTSNGKPKIRTYELRSGFTGDKVMLILKWST